jgi:ribose transport system permease protein
VSPKTASDQPADAPPGATRNNGSGAGRFTRLMRGGFGASNLRLVGVLVLICLVFSVLNSSFYTRASITNIFVSAVLVLLLALGETYVLISAGIDLSVASMLALSGMVAGKVMSSMFQGREGSAWGITLVGLVCALAVGLVGGMLNGWAISWLKLNSLIVTLGTMGIFAGAAALISGGNPITNFPGSTFTIGNGTWGVIPIIVFIAVVVVLIFTFISQQTRFGRHIYAVGSNREALRRSGVSVPAVTIGVFGISGLVAGLAGFLDTAHFLTASPTAGSEDLLLAVAAVVIGGTPLEGGEGSIIGTVIGALIISVLQNGFIILGVQSYWQLVAVGVVTIIAVYAGERERVGRIFKGN